MTLTPIAQAVDAFVGIFGNPPAHVRARADRIAQLKARAFDLALQEALRIEREAEAARYDPTRWEAPELATQAQDVATLRGEVRT